MPQPTRPQVFIEKIMPVTLLNKQVYYEHGGNPFKGLHRWYSRKPLSFSRASELASLLPADVTAEEFEYLSGLNPRVNGIQDSTTKLYKTPPTIERIKKVQDLCEKTWGTRTPTVLDAFAGGGSIPFEAARYGFNVLASDLNPVAVVTMKAAMEYPLKFGADLQQDIDKWVKWVGDEAEKRLAEFFPSLDGEKVQNYLWAHTVVCPSCESVVPLSPNWWLDRSHGSLKKGQWSAVRPIPNLESKCIDFEMIKGKKGEGTTVITESGEEYDPESATTIARGVGKCPNCGNVIAAESIYEAARQQKIGHQLYAVAYRKGKGELNFRVTSKLDLQGFELANQAIRKKVSEFSISIPSEEIPEGFKTDQNYIRVYSDGIWAGVFNFRQLLTLVTYVEIINKAKELMRTEYELDRVEAIANYLALVLDRCVDKNCRLAHINVTGPKVESASATHSLNLMWNYPETNGCYRLWEYQAESVTDDYQKLCNLLGTKDTRNVFNIDLQQIIFKPATKVLS